MGFQRSFLTSWKKPFPHPDPSVMPTWQKNSQRALGGTIQAHQIIIFLSCLAKKEPPSTLTPQGWLHPFFFSTTFQTVSNKGRCIETGGESAVRAILLGGGSFWWINHLCHSISVELVFPLSQQNLHFWRCQHQAHFLFWAVKSKSLALNAFWCHFNESSRKGTQQEWSCRKQVLWVLILSVAFPKDPCCTRS